MKNKNIREVKYVSYLANSNTLEIHDLDNAENNCQIDEIKYEHIIHLQSMTQVLDYINNKDYNGCAWCLPEHHTD